MPSAQEVKQAVRLSDWIARDTEVKPTRRPGIFLARCPKHDDKHPSLRIDDNKGLFHCDPCHWGGDVFTWLCEVEKLPFTEAFRKVAESVGMDGDLGDPREAAHRKEREAVAEIMEAAAAWCQAELTEEHVKILTDRYHLQPETIRKAGIGYWGRSFIGAMKTVGYTEEDLLRCALLAKADDGRLYCPLERRLVLPFRVSGHIVYMTGRHLADKPARAIPKYMHLSTGLPSTSPFIRRPMYGRDSLVGADRVLVVEGPFDALAVRERNPDAAVVAAMSASLTPEFAQEIRSLCPSADITILADGEQVGILGALGSALLLIQAGGFARIQVLPPGEDPASLGDALDDLRPPQTPVEVWETILPTLTETEQTETFNKAVVPLLAAYPIAERDAAIKRVASCIGATLSTVRAAITRADTAPTPESAIRYSPTDLGNAQRLIHHHGADLRYQFSQKSGAWYYWTGRVWELDQVGEVDRRAKGVIQRMYAELAEIQNDRQRNKFLQFIRRSESTGARKSMIEAAQSESGVPILPRDWDSDPWLLNVENGMIRLKDCKLLPHEREAYCRRMAPVSYDAKAECPRWLEFLEEITAGDKDLQQFLQRAVGYSLTGDVSEQCVFVLYGTGANGKSTFLTTLETMLGAYVSKSAFEAFLVKRGDDGPRNDLADLAGARMVIAMEPEPGRRLAESVIKEVTGGDTVKARFLYQEHFTYKPTYKLWFATNHKPTIRGTDTGIWRRIRLVPFTVTIPPEKRDHHLPERLAAEAPGILSWALEGTAAWMAYGLGEPTAVREATQRYREESDILGEFLGQLLHGPEFTVNVRHLYASYERWAEDQGERPSSARIFAAMLRERGYDTRRVHGGATMWMGIAIPGTTLGEQ